MTYVAISVNIAVTPIDTNIRGHWGWVRPTITGTRHRVPAGFAHAYVYGALAGLIGLLVSGALGDWVIPFVYNIGFAGFRAGILGWLFWGGLLAIENMSRREPPALSDA